MTQQIVWHKTKYPGVRYRESNSRTYKRRSDRSFVIHYKKNGKLVNETIGWESQGATLEKAAQLRAQIIQNIRLGDGFHSIREKRGDELKKREDEFAEAKAKEQENISLEQVAKRYLEWAQNNKKSWKDDESRYRFHIRPALGKKPIHNLSPIILERFKRTLISKRLSPATVKHCLVLIRQIINKGIGWGIFTGPNPVRETSRMDKGFLKSSDNKRLRFLTFEEAKNLLTKLKVKSIQTHDICFLSLNTGMRMGEIFALTWQDVDLTHNIIHIRNPKNNQTRQSYLTPILKEVLIARRPLKENRGDLIFCDSNGNRIRQLSKVFGRVVDELGLNQGVKDSQNKIVPHTLRHTFASWLCLQGEGLLTIKELLGHRDISTTQRYSHLLPDQKRKAVRELSDKLTHLDLSFVSQEANA